MKMLYLKFHQNRTINEEFKFWGIKQRGTEGGGGRGSPIQKIRKSPIQNGGPIAHRKL